MNSETQHPAFANTPSPVPALPSAIAIDCNRFVRHLVWSAMARPPLPGEDPPPLQWL
jgi:hypothetical protein